jgi:hypothetical protein
MSDQPRKVLSRRRFTALYIALLALLAVIALTLGGFLRWIGWHPLAIVGALWIVGGCVGIVVTRAVMRRMGPLP